MAICLQEVIKIYILFLSVIVVIFDDLSETCCLKQDRNNLQEMETITVLFSFIPRWEDNIKGWTGLEWNIILRKAENREEWSKLVVKSTVVP